MCPSTTECYILMIFFLMRFICIRWLAMCTIVYDVVAWTQDVHKQHNFLDSTFFMLLQRIAPYWACVEFYVYRLAVNICNNMIPECLKKQPAAASILFHGGRASNSVKYKNDIPLVSQFIVDYPLIIAHWMVVRTGERHFIGEVMEDSCRVLISLELIAI